MGMQTAESVSINNSILKEILSNKNCSVGKYLAPMSCVEDNGTISEYFITPVVTISKKQVLIISRVINGNWYESLRIINSLIADISFKYDLKKDAYTILLHAYFNVIGLEQFYEVDTSNGNQLNKISFTALENLLS